MLYGDIFDVDWAEKSVPDGFSESIELGRQGAMSPANLYTL